MSAKGFEHRSGGFYYIDGLQTAMSGAIRGTGQQKKGARICVPWLTDRIEPQKKVRFLFHQILKLGGFIGIPVKCDLILPIINDSISVNYIY